MNSALSNSRDLKNFIAKEGHGVKGISDMRLQDIPKLYIQPLEERMNMNSVLQEVAVPIINMSNLDDKMVADSICNAAENLGFFQIINHGVPIQVLENVKEATRRFFQMPAEEKIKFTKEKSPTNSVRLLTSFSPEVDEALEWKDYLSLFYVSDEESSAFWPSVCKDEAMEFLKWSECVTRKLLKVLMKRLNIDEIGKTKEALLMGSKRINLNYYPLCPNPELTIGVGRHSDVSTLTILLQDNIGGLYVRKLETDSWIHIPPVGGSLVINIGDALQIMSNNRYKSAEHRVVANGSKDRVSVPIFVNPSPNSVIGPFAEVLEAGEKAMYKEVLYSDYVKHFYKKRHNGKDTIEFAKI